MRSFSNNKYRGDRRGGFDRNQGDRFSYRRGNRSDRQMFKAVCSNCGKDCEVPFSPSGDKPVYCSDCFEKMGDRGNRRSFDKPRFGERKHQDTQFIAQFETVNAKLDEIINILKPKPVAETTLPTETVVEAPIKEIKIKVPKVKKPAKEKVSKE